MLSKDLLPWSWSRCWGLPHIWSFSYTHHFCMHPTHGKSMLFFTCESLSHVHMLQKCRIGLARVCTWSKIYNIIIRCDFLHADFPRQLQWSRISIQLGSSLNTKPFFPLTVLLPCPISYLKINKYKYANILIVHHAILWCPSLLSLKGLDFLNQES